MLNVIVYNYNKENKKLKWAVVNQEKRLIQKGVTSTSRTNIDNIVHELKRDFHTTIAVQYKKKNTLITNLLKR